ncbi:MAG: hypothetical protein ACE5H0_07375 [Bacteroidota bacterium]
MTQPFEQRATDFLNDLGKDSVHVQETTRDFAASNPDGITDPRIQRSVQRVAGLTKPLLRLSITLSPPSELNYEQLRRYHSAAVHDLNATSQKCSENYTYMRVVHKKLAGQIIKTLKSCDHHMLALETLLQEYREVVNSIAQLKDRATDLQQARLCEVHMIEAIKQATTSIESSEAQLKGLEADFASLQLDSEWSIFIKLSEEKQAYEGKFAASAADITRLISPVEKSIRKYTRLVDEGQKTVDNRKILNAYASATLEAVPMDRDARILVSTVQQIRDSILAEDLELKDMRKQKTLERLVELETQLPRMYQRYNILEAEIRNIGDRLGQMGITLRMERLKERITQKKNEVAFQRQTLDQVQKEVKDCQQKAEAQRRAVEELVVDILRVNVRIRYIALIPPVAFSQAW